MKAVTQVRCPTCGVVYSEAAFPAHQADGGGCARPETLGLTRGPGLVWMLPEEALVTVTCSRCGVTFSQAGHEAHRPDEMFECVAPGTVGLVRDTALGVWHLPHE